MAELSDNECWTTLESLARQGTYDDLADACGEALVREREHLRRVRAWIAAGQGRSVPEDVGDGLHRYRNYSERYYGPVTLREALANSLNIPALKLLHGIGPTEYLQFLSRLGVTSLEAHPEMYGDGLALGNG